MSLPSGPASSTDAAPLSTDWEGVCDRFEEEFRNGGTPSLEATLQSAAAEVRPRLFAELLSIECWWRKRRGELAQADDYLSRFPDYREAIVAAFSADRHSDSTPPTAGIAPPVAPVVPPSSTLDIGSTLGPYRLEKLLGEGGMGVVFRAVHTKLDKVVAVKILSTAFMHHPDAAARFQREMKAVGRVTHPHVVQAFDAGEIDGTHYLAMEYVDGQDLATILKERGPLPLGTACRLIREAADALSAAHAAGLVHRDVKPSNLLLDAHGRVKLLDLGLSRILSRDDKPGTDLTTLGQIFGTADYMAPEQWDDPRKADARTDLYALGCTLFHFLTGEPPFASGEYQTVFSKMQGHISAPMPEVTDFAPQTPATVIEVCRRLMSKKPEERFATADDVIRALASFANAEVVLPPPSKAGSETDERRPSTSMPVGFETDVGSVPVINSPTPATTRMPPGAGDSALRREYASSSSVHLIRAGLVLLADDNEYDRRA
ncbi:MAG TPA: serine/threonine-protein kinase, partial [Planctomycetaceae bacterium]|nr:serine/threonine-protein kinase [Planctomycetaceae bacterium]